MATIRYTQAERDNAAKRDKDLFIVGYAEAKGKGGGEACGPMKWEMGNALFSFCYAVYGGKTPAAAFAETKWPSSPDGPEGT